MKINDLVLACAKLLVLTKFIRLVVHKPLEHLHLELKIEKVDKIVGPEMLLLQCKKKVFEVDRYDCRSIGNTIIADDKNNPNHIAIDLLPRRAMNSHNQF